jgi:hypothetical protein
MPFRTSLEQWNFMISQLHVKFHIQNRPLTITAYVTPLRPKKENESKEMSSFFLPYLLHVKVLVAHGDLLEKYCYLIEVLLNSKGHGAVYTSPMLVKRFCLPLLSLFKRNVQD